jgi:hypothetical protein
LRVGSELGQEIWHERARAFFPGVRVREKTPSALRIHTSL